MKIVLTKTGIAEVIIFLYQEIANRTFIKAVFTTSALVSLFSLKYPYWDKSLTAD
jgi:hypothetical protein